MEDDRAPEIAATFERIQRPLRWPMENFARRRIANRSFAGYRFSRVRRNAQAGFCFGFALKSDAIPGVVDPPEVVAYAFVKPTESSLYRTLVGKPGSAVRRLVGSSQRMGFPFVFEPRETTAAVRHRSMRHVPKEIFVLVASDFLMLCYQPLRAAGFLERVRKATTAPG
ncbi:MAG TPA: hypothetical protein VIL58_06360 [Thermoplasmata archaeon]